jgi:hypothetical protein
MAVGLIDASAARTTLRTGSPRRSRGYYVGAMHPLSSWVCDTCGQKITEPQSANVISRVLDDDATAEYRIVHKNMGGRTCDPGAKGGFLHNMSLDTYLGPDGLAWILSELSLGPLREGQGQPRVDDVNQFVDFVRRVQTPWYEEARRRFGERSVQDALSDANEVLPYLPETLERIAKGET